MNVLHSLTHMSSYFRTASVVAGLVLLLAAPAHANLIFADNMDYGAVDGDTFYDPPWNDGSGRTTYEASNVSFTNAAYSNTTNGASTGSLGLNSGAGDPRGAHIEFSSTPLTGDFWLSAIINLSSGTNHIISLSDSSGIATGSIPADGFGLTVNGGNAQAVFYDGSFTAQGAADLTLNAPLLMVAKVTVNSGGNDSLKLWVFEEGDTFGPTEASLGSARIDTTTADFEDGIQQLWAGRSSGTSNVDGFRISDASGDTGLNEVLTAIPEPGTFSLILLSGAALLFFRCRS